MTEREFHIMREDAKLDMMEYMEKVSKEEYIKAEPKNEFYRAIRKGVREHFVLDMLKKENQKAKSKRVITYVQLMKGER